MQFLRRRYALHVAILVSVSTSTAASVAQDPTPPPQTVRKPAARMTVYRRLTAQFLEGFDRDRAALADTVRSVDVPYPLQRGTFHFHSRLSHDSEGTIDEIIAAARATGTRVIGFTEHPSRTVDVVAENVSGWKDGIFFLAGTESSNELHWPGKEKDQQLRFVCHPEEVPTFDRNRYDGIEVYNTHSDVKDEPMKMVLAAMILNMGAVRNHPEAAFCSFLDWPEDFLTRFDRLTMQAPFSGIAGNDSHQNQSLEIAALPGGAIEVLDYSGEVAWSDDGVQAKTILAAMGKTARLTKRTVLTSIRLDPYAISMRHVGTFLQIDEISESSVRKALREGRIILGFELVAPLPAVGFWVEYKGAPAGTVGDRLHWQKGMKLHARLPAEAQIRLVRNGIRIKQLQSDRLKVEVEQGGVYRLEALQTLAGQQYPWVISNPIYLEDNAD